MVNIELKNAGFLTFDSLTSVLILICIIMAEKVGVQKLNKFTFVFFLFIQDFYSEHFTQINLIISKSISFNQLHF